jgi:2-phosphosulfolactate phosphatase
VLAGTVSLGWFDQASYDLRCEWGAAGITALAPSVDVLILVDVLSFSTCVDIALSHGAIVYPYPWKADSAAEFARSVGGLLAGPRSRDHVSLSPASFRTVAPSTRIVLPSPNGASLSGMTGRVPTLTGCLRNAAAVARAAQSFGPRIGVIAAGERWPDGSLRPSVEDWLGAGAILSHLKGRSSPEATLACAAFMAHRGALGTLLHESVSGRELVDEGWADDVFVAAEVNVSTTAPVLRDGAYCSQ